MKELERVRKRDPSLVAFLQECMSRSGARLDLDSYLIKPVQRLPRYQLLLRELIKFTGMTMCVVECVVCVRISVCVFMYGAAASVCLFVCLFVYCYPLLRVVGALTLKVAVCSKMHVLNTFFSPYSCFFDIY